MAGASELGAGKNETWDSPAFLATQDQWQEAVSLGTLHERAVSSAHVLIHPKFAWSMSPVHTLMPGVMRTLKSVKPGSRVLDVGTT